VVYEEALKVSVSIRLARLVVPVVRPVRRGLFRPLLGIGDEAVLGVIGVHACRDVHGRDEGEALPDAAASHRILQPVCHVDELAVLDRVEPQVVG